MTPGKKWYSYFVVTDEPAPDDAGSPAQTVDEMFPDAAAAPAVPVPSDGHAADFDAVYQAAQIASPVEGHTAINGSQ